MAVEWRAASGKDSDISHCAALINRDILNSPLALNDALTELKKFDPRLAEVVELRFFGGLTTKEIATLMEHTTQTVYRDWRAAQAWLLREMGVQRPLEGFNEADQGPE
jgi:DNA-directed RNA polymerase specialized sigma24 family protein